MYKKLLYLLIALPLLTAAQTKTYPSKIDQVTVFRAGAQVLRKANIKLTPGQNEIVITDLPAGFDESSIQVSTKDKATINAVSYRNNFGKDFSANPEYKALTDQKEILLRKKENENIVLDTWKEEESLLLANKKVNGDDTGLNTTQLAALADLYRSRLLEVKTKLLDTRRKVTDIDKDITKLDAQINDWSAKNTKTNTGEVVVSVLANSASETTMDVMYFDPRASWQTSFDLRLESLQKPLSLTNKGKIIQYTGEDWKDINLLLTTGNPTLYAQAPVIQTWFLRYIEQMYALGNAKQNTYARPLDQTRMTANIRGSRDDESINFIDGVRTAGSVPQSIRENITFSEYTLPHKMTIPSDSKEHEVTLKENEVDAFYQYLAIPKYDNKVFLMANVKDWEQYNFSSGEVKLYFEGTYVGTTFLNAGEASDTLKISLGPDIAINAKREKLKDFSKTAFLSSKKQIKSGYEITLKNNKPSEIEVVLKDQIPIATDATMEVEAEELSGGKLNKETGIVEWTIKLKPGEQIKKKIGYSVKIPKDKKVDCN
jgi:uncharacterized protein (TIGR02231 family)